MITLTVGDMTFSSDPASLFSIDEAGIDGLTSSPGVKTEPDDRANGDGTFGVAEFYRSARAITVPGLYVGSGDEVADAMVVRRLAGLFSDGTPGELTFTDPVGPRTAEVILAGDACLVTPLVFGMASYQIAMLAPDPVLYGPASNPSTGLPSSGGGLEYNLFNGGAGGALYYGANGNLGRVTLTNDGTADSWPMFTVTGTLDSGFYIRRLDTGQTLRYDRVVPAGTTVTIDSRTGEVLIDGVSDASTYLTLDEFFAVPRMGSCEVQFVSLGSSSGSPTLTATIRDGWW